MRIVGYRVASYRTPVRDTPSNEPGRFHTAGSPPAQYLCLHPLGPSAEVVRHARLDAADQLAVLALRIWALRIDLPDDLPELTYRNCGEVAGLTPEQLVGDDYASTQLAAEALRESGANGFIFPSAALPGTRNVVLFGERVAIGYQDDSLDDWEVPASMTTSRGAPPVSLHRLVRRIGHPHAELEAAQRGEPFRFDEPSWAVESTPAR
jgi:RES domain-containing protein